MSDGFLPIARKIVDSPVWKMGPLAVQVWIWLLLKTVWKTEGVTMRNGIHLKRGQLWTTYDLMREGLRVRKGRGYTQPASTTLKDTITRLKADRMVDLKADRNGLIITICKYDEYNPIELESRPNSRPERNRLADPEVQGEEQVPRHPTPPTAHARAYDCGWTRAILKDWKSVHELPSNASEQACLKVIHDLHRIDKKSPETIATVCAFIVRNKVPQFIKSPMKLRQKTRTGDQQTFEMYEWEIGKKAPSQRERKTMRQRALEKNARQRAALKEAGINAPNR